VRILVLALGVPFPPLGGGLTRTFHLLKALAARHDVTLAAFTYGDAHEAPPYRLNLRSVPWHWSEDYERMTGADAAAAHRAYVRLTHEVDEPWFAGVMDPGPMRALLVDALRGQPDLVLFEGMPLARFLPEVPSGVTRVIDLFDIHSVMAREAVGDADDGNLAALTREAERTLAFERKAVRQCDACLAVSEPDVEAARHLLGATSVHLVPNGVDTSYFSPSSRDPDPGALLFTGRMAYSPNADAARYFAELVLPLVRREVPHARFHIVGDAPPPRVLALASDAVRVYGRVDDIRAFHSRSEVVVVPILSGGGTRLKILEAAACGQAIVSTRLGAEGLPFRDGDHLLIADSPADFAAAVVALLRNPERRAQLGSRARAVAAQFDWVDIGQSFTRVIENILRDRA
jgi:polysaccharide biosynthesis protein PslH